MNRYGGISAYTEAVREALNNLDMEHTLILADKIASVLSEGHIVALCGNGGSGFVASHFALEVLKNIDSGNTSRIVSLSDNVGLITAYGNDVSFETVFSGQVRALLGSGDLLVGLSASGRSQNIITALDEAVNVGATCALISGSGAPWPVNPDVCQHIVVPSTDTQVCEDAFHFICHAMYRHLRDEVFND